MAADTKAENASCFQGIQAPTRTQTYHLSWTIRPMKYLENHSAHSALLSSIHPPPIYLSIYPSTYQGGTHPPSHPPIHSFIDPSTLPSVHLIFSVCSTMKLLNLLSFAQW